MTVVKATVTHTLNTSMFPQKLPQNSSFAMANARFSDDSDLQQYWMSICAREREAKSRNARILRELESLERRFNVMEIRTKKIVELKVVLLR